MGKQIPSALYFVSFPETSHHYSYHYWFVMYSFVKAIFHSFTYIMSVRFNPWNCVRVVCSISLLFSMLLYEYTIMYSLYSEGHSCCLHLGAVLNKTATNTFLLLLVHIVYVSIGCTRRRGLPGSILVHSLKKVLFKMVVPVYASISRI